MSTDLNKGLTIDGSPDAVIVHRVDHLRYHGDVYAVAVDIDIHETPADDRIEIMEVELDDGTLRTIYGESKSAEMPLSAFDVIAKLVEQRKRDR